MKNRCFFMALILTLLFSILFSCTDNLPERQRSAVFESLSGAYLGQTPPETEPEIFAPGVVSTRYSDKTEDALSVLQFTVEKFPEDLFAYYSLARIHRQLCDLDKAIASCRKALEISPGFGDVSQMLERLFKEKEEKD